MKSKIYNFGSYSIVVSKLKNSRPRRVQAQPDPPYSWDAPVADNYARFIQEVPEPGFHIVALGEFGLDELPGILEAGCAGVAVSAAISDSENPVEATSAMIEVLEKARYGG